MIFGEIQTREIIFLLLKRPFMTIVFVIHIIEVLLITNFTYPAGGVLSFHTQSEAIR